MDNTFNWANQAAPVDAAIFKDYRVVDVLYDFDGPRIFTAQTPLGLMLFYLADAQIDSSYYIAAPTSDSIIALLTSGVRAVRDALNQPWIWFVQTRPDGAPVAAWQGTLADAPADALPQPGIMLWSHLEPVFALRALGDGLAEGTIPASVIRLLVDGATTALKKVASHVFQNTHTQGRKSNAVRQLYDLPLQNLAYNSFELAFKLPLEPEASAATLSSEFAEIGKQMVQTMAWAISDNNNLPTPEPDIDLLEALEKLVPPQTGQIKAIELRGRIFSTGQPCYQLTRNTTLRVRQALNVARGAQERIIKVTGLVRQLDVDELVFTLRETDDAKDHLCRFESEYFDDVFESLNTPQRVTVSGRENLKNGQIDALLVSLEPAGQA